MADPLALSRETPGIKVRWETEKTNLAFMKVSERNAVFRKAITWAADRWRANYLGARFTRYVTRPEFGYHGPSPTRKALGAIRMMPNGAPLPGAAVGELSSRAQGLINTFAGGWNPWSQGLPPETPALRESFSTLAEASGAAARSLGSIRKWAWPRLVSEVRPLFKKKLREAFKNLELDGLMLPLVSSGELRKGAKGGIIRASSTSNKLTARVPVPFPGPRNINVGRVIRFIPPAEYAFFGRKFGEALDAAQAGRAAVASEAPQRSTAAAPPRAVP